MGSNLTPSATFDSPILNNPVNNIIPVKHMTKNRKLICGLIYLALVIFGAGCSAKFLGEPKKLAAQDEQQRTNFILIVTDDQRYDTLWAMENLRNELVTRGIKFTEGFVTTPLCCPSRASILTGLYSHNTGVLRNKGLYGGAPGFKDSQKDKQTIAVWLQYNGYKTALIGKYLNRYRKLVPYIPPGWSKWMTFTGDDFNKNSFNTDGIEIKDVSGYSTESFFEEAVKFVRDNINNPFFLYLALTDPHWPATPSEQDKNKFNDFLYRPISYNEKDNSDKNNPMVKGREVITGKWQKELDDFTRNQLRTLQAVDRGIKSIIDELVSKDLLHNTVIIFTSDHGYLWGEHRLEQKGSPYEEAIRIPFIIYVPGISGGRIDRSNLVLNIDIAPTILELAGVEKPQDIEFDGKSIVPILKNPDDHLRDEFWIEYIGDKTVRKYDEWRTFYGIRTSKFKLIEYLNGEREFFDLSTDPYELDNQYENPEYQDTIAELELKLEVLKQEVTALLIQRKSTPEEAAHYMEQRQEWKKQKMYEDYDDE